MTEENTPMKQRERVWARPSNLWLLERCPASGAESAGLPRAGSDATVLGTAIHELLAIRVMHGLASALEQVRSVSDRYGVDPALMRRWLEGVSWEVHGTAAVLAEEEVVLDLDWFTLRGRADVILFWPESSTVEVTDFKSGSELKLEDHWIQLFAYALGAAQRFNAKHLQVSLCFVKDNSWYHAEVDPVAARERIENILQEAFDQEQLPVEKRRYVVTEACRWCPARSHCWGLNTDLKAFVSLVEAGAWQVTTDNAAKLIDRAGIVEKLARAVRDAVKDEVRARGGKLVADDGRTLELVTSERREYTVPAGSVERLVVRR